jgi:hypothetical protein
LYLQLPDLTRGYHRQSNEYFVHVQPRGVIGCFTQLTAIIAALAGNRRATIVGKASSRREDLTPTKIVPCFSTFSKKWNRYSVTGK